MHELTITQNILEISLRAAKEQGAAHIHAIRLAIGPFSGVVPDCVQMYLDVLAKGTPAEGARIEARRLPLRVECRDCGTKAEIDRSSIRCPVCGGVRLKRLSGRECTVESLEVD